MTIRPKLLSALFAVFVSVASCTSFAQVQASSGNVGPDVTSNVTTTGGISGYLPVFTGTSAVVDSIVFQNSLGIGIGDVPNAALDVNGKAIFRGPFQVARIGNATPSSGVYSNPFSFFAQAYDTATKGNVGPYFSLQAEPTNNNSAAPGATLNLLYDTGLTPSAAETGLYINSNGSIHFAPSQTFPGGTGSGAPFCIATAGGFGSGGTTFVDPGFAVPAEGKCTPWSGFTKTASTVILTTSGTACLSSDGTAMTVSVSSADPAFLGAGNLGSDYIQLTRSGSSGSFTSGTDMGQFGGSAASVTCTASLLNLPSSHD